MQLPGECRDDRLRGFARRASCIGAAFHALSYYEEDTGRKAGVTVEPGEACRIEIVDEAECNREVVDRISSSLPRLLGAPLAAEYSCATGTGDARLLRYRGLARALLDSLTTMVLDCLRSLSRRGREHFYIAGWGGEYALGEGSERSVTLPSVPGVVFIHTHPGTCYPSSKDLQSFADFFSSGGLVEAIVSPGCALAFYLEEPLQEEDYWSLMDAARCVARSKDGATYTDCLNRLFRMRSVKMQLL